MTDFDDAFIRRGSERAQALRDVLPEEALEGLAREVVLRLARKAPPYMPTDPHRPDSAVIDRLCTALVAVSPQDAQRMMAGLQKDGLTLDTLYSEYLAPAAVQLGVLWDNDKLSFTAVTLGAGRIYELIRMLRDALPPPVITHREPVLFTTVPGEQHGVGVEMAAELFRQHGWDVHLLVGADHDGIMAEIAAFSYLVVGMSSAGRANAAALARLIHAVRVAHPEIFVIVGGKIVTQEPDLVALLQPDSAVASVEDALATMERLTPRDLQTNDV